MKEISDKDRKSVKDAVTRAARKPGAQITLDKALISRLKDAQHTKLTDQIQELRDRERSFSSDTLKLRIR